MDEKNILNIACLILNEIINKEGMEIWF